MLALTIPRRQARRCAGPRRLPARVPQLGPAGSSAPPGTPAGGAQARGGAVLIRTWSVGSSGVTTGSSATSMARIASIASLPSAWKS